MDAETQVTDGKTGSGGDQQGLVPGLTILGHPDHARVGDRLALPALAMGQGVNLSRLDPLFQNPQTGLARPLTSVQLSRQPIRLAGGDEPGAITLDPRSSRTPVLVESQPIVGSRSFRAKEVAEGVVFEIGHRVVLLLHLQSTAPNRPHADDVMIGESHALAIVRDNINRLTNLDVPVLIRGATGSGKELVARALHQTGARQSGPFVAVNMATLPSALAAAELFGAVKGAYTGADRHKAGFFHAANGGTLFLDEIGEAPGELQAMLLRALETGAITPIGSTESRAVNVRIVAATDADIEHAMAEDQFRSPLFHRLAGFTIRVPSLTERRDDIGRLLLHFLRQEMESLDSIVDTHNGRPWPTTTLTARLARHNWPGNVRQLRNVARWLAIKGPEGLLQSPMELDHLLGVGPNHPTMDRSLSRPPAVQSPAKGPARLKLYRSPREVTDDEVLGALRAHGWRLKPTAKHLRVSRTSLYALIDRCPSIRRAGDLQRTELTECSETHQGDLIAMANELEVSPQGLRQRLQALGITRA